VKDPGVLRRTRDLGEIIADSFSLFFKHWQRLLQIASPLIVAALAFGFLTVFQQDAINVTGTAEQGDLAIEITTSFWLGLAVLPFAIVIGWIVTQVVNCAVVHALAVLEETGELPQAEEAWQAAWKKLGSVLGASLRMLVITLLLAITLVGIPWAIARIVRWIFIPQAIMLDGATGRTALATSASLVHGHWWNTLGRYILLSLIVGIPAWGLSSTVSAAIPGYFGGVLGSMASYALSPVSLIGMTLIYYDLKLKRTDETASAIEGPTLARGEDG
jgi:hypothetical protein